MTTWTEVAQDASGGTFTDFPQIATIGYYGFNEADKTTAEDLKAIALLGYLSDIEIISPWSAVDKQTSTWTGVVQSGTVAAQFELNEPLGGPVWTEVEKDS